MSKCRDTTISGFNEFLQGQAAQEGAGEAYLTLVKFDAPRVTTLWENTPVATCPRLDTALYQPRGGTNLMDAVGQTMTRINSLLAATPVDQRPAVLVVILTDGEENASTQYHGETIRAMVRAAETKGDWAFMFLGANVDAFAMGASFGMGATNTAVYNTSNMGATMRAASKAANSVRVAKSAGVSTADLYSADLYGDADRRSMRGE